MNKLNGWATNLLLEQEKLPKNTFSKLMIILGITLPFLLVTCIHSFYWGDVGTFHVWAECWSQKIYVDCQKIPNYPINGLVLSAGIIHSLISIFHITERHTLYAIFRYYLAFFDAMNFLLFIWLASLMRFRFPLLIGLILLIIPSTWVGGAVWGQIDGITLFFCLLSSICFFKSWLVNDGDNNNQKVWKNGLWLVLGMLNLVFYILTKQLAIFSLPFFCLLFLITVKKFNHSFGYKGLIWVFLSLLICAFSFRYIDSLFAVPEQFYNSSYWFVWKGGGSEHGNTISGGGFNLWMFLGRDATDSAHVPFFTLKIGNFKDNISPYQAGFFLYSILMSFLLFTSYQGIVSVIKDKVDVVRKNKDFTQLIAILCFFHGLSHLGFNIFLCGTQARYMYIGYPFLLIAILWFYQNKIVFQWRAIIYCFFAAAAYGGFVFAQFGTLPKLLFPLQRHLFLGSIHLFLWVFLLDIYVQICKQRQIINKIAS